MRDTPRDAAPACALLARAKVNLSLRVLAREHGGYHQIETTLCLIELADEITVTILRDDDILLDVQSAPEAMAPPPDLGPIDANLAVRAAAAFRRRTNIEAGARIDLVKRVPAGAGLGGGSSDAAAVLEALNTLHGAPLSRDELVELAGRLGSDVPFFAARAPLALAWGRGGRLAALPPLPAKPVLLVIPPYGSETAAAYAALAVAHPGDFDARARLLNTEPAWADVAADAINEFEPIVFQQRPELAQLRYGLEKNGALLARMTGSGSVVFGVFDRDTTMADARLDIAARFPQMRLIATRTVTL